MKSRVAWPSLATMDQTVQGMRVEVVETSDAAESCHSTKAMLIKLSLAVGVVAKEVAQRFGESLEVEVGRASADRAEAAGPLLDGVGRFGSRVVGVASTVSFGCIAVARAL